MKIQVEVEVEQIAESIIKQLVETGRVVEVVRCKDCKYHDANECKHSHALIVSKDDDFCSYAERRIDE